MLNILENFTNHAEYGVVPAKLREGVKEPSFSFNNKEFAPKNCFFKSVHYVDSVVGRVKDVVFGVNRSDYGINSRTHTITGIIRPAVFALTNIALQPLYLAFACLSYWLAKGLAKITDKFDLKDKTESLVNYSNMLSNKAETHSRKVGEFINKTLSYAFAFVIWTIASLITPFIWAGEKVASKLSKTQAPEPAKDAKIGAAPTTP
ncbi:hypothetical protein [Wolbachia endosymbiont (group E) of Neria commutata]|uniref:hypothetical protein n=1 Tax=Wolbachia endosymbiont (group E) of Neria commutata TaxID=3066149 RepID=UPI003132BF18